MELFGFKFGKRQVEDEDTTIRLPVEENDGSVVISSGTSATYQMSVDPAWKSEADLINYYRDMAMNHNIDRGIEEIVTDAIVVDKDQPVEVDFHQTSKLSDAIKRKITAEFDTILRVLNFRDDAHSIFRSFYVDGRIAVFMVVDPKNTKRGIVGAQFLDVVNLRKVRKINKRRGPGNGPEIIESIEEYFAYSGMNEIANRNNIQRTEMRIKPEAVSYVTSGLLDQKNNWVISYLHKAIRPQNHLRLLEDAALIYKMVRAPERRVFYIDVGNLPRNRSEEYLRDIMNKYRNKITYDAATGDVKDDRRAMSMIEDFWLPRREGGRGTEISTLPGGTNQGVEDLEYFKRNLYESLNIPLGRLESSDGFSMGKTSEITRDEVRFASFIDKLRSRFALLFFDLLRTQLILKGIISVQDWDDIKPQIQFIFNSNVLFAEMKESEIIQYRLGNLQSISPYVGEYYSKRWVQKNVLMMTDDDITQIEEEIKGELESGAIVPPGDEEAEDAPKIKLPDTN